MTNPYVNPEDFEESCPDTENADIDFACITDLNRYLTPLFSQLSDHVNNPTLSTGLRASLHQLRLELTDAFQENLQGRITNLHDYYALLDTEEYRQHLAKMGKINHAEDKRMET